MENPLSPKYRGKFRVKSLIAFIAAVCTLGAVLLLLFLPMFEVEGMDNISMYDNAKITFEAVKVIWQSAGVIGGEVLLDILSIMAYVIVPMIFIAIAGIMAVVEVIKFLLHFLMAGKYVAKQYDKVVTGKIRKWFRRDSAILMLWVAIILQVLLILIKKEDTGMFAFLTGVSGQMAIEGILLAVASVLGICGCVLNDKMNAKISSELVRVTN